MSWIALASVIEGPVFRPLTKGGRILNARLSDRSVAEIIKTHAARVGLDPAQFSGHSLRSGFLTSAAARGASIFKLADQSRHKSMDVLRSYVRDAEVFRITPATACCRLDAGDGARRHNQKGCR
jgi:integrase